MAASLGYYCVCTSHNAWAGLKLVTQLGCRHMHTSDTKAWNHAHAARADRPTHTGPNTYWQQELT